MKKMLLLAGVASVFALNANAFEFNPYLSAKVKYAITDNSITTEAGKKSLDKDLFGGSGALGVKFPFANSAVRVEAEYVRTADAKKTFHDEKAKSELRVQGLMFNAYYDFYTKTPFTPYVSAGMGGARMKYSTDLGAIHQTEFAWQLGFGVAYEINEHFAADLGYRFIDYGDFSNSFVEHNQVSKTKTENVYHKTKVESQANEIMLGLRYTF
ncbi:MAG: porin family protein [Alphaproteobacteria bacterium]|nr:porin family protein [Alphaproteobacteria bacterium]